MIRLKDGRYRERIDGKYFYGHTKAEVNRKIAAWNKDHKDGILFGETLDAWDQYRYDLVNEGKLAYNTYASTKTTVKRLHEQFGKTPTCKITPAMIDAYIKQVDGAKRTVQMYLDVLRMVYRYAIVHNHTTTNPCDAVELPKGLKSKKRMIPPDDILEKIDNHYDIPFGMFAYFLYYSGLRKGELLALRWDDIDFDEEIIHVRRSLYWKVNQPMLKDPKTEAGIRDVPLLDNLKAVLEPKKSGYIFAGDNGGLMTQTVFRRRWSNYCRAAGIAKCTRVSHVGKNGHLYHRNVYHDNLEPHALRHAFATILFEADVDERDSMEILGHSSIQVTRDVYTHIRKSRLKKTVKQINNHLSKVV